MNEELKQQIESLITEARAKGVSLLVGDIKFATIGIPKIIDGALLFPAGSALMNQSGKMGGPIAGYETLPYPRLVMMQAVCTVDMCPTPKKN